MTTDQTHCREFTAAEVEVEAAYIGQFHSEQAVRTRDMLEAYARILRNTRAQASAPEGGEVGAPLCYIAATTLDSFKKISDAGSVGFTAFKSPEREFSIPLFTRSNAKAGEVDDAAKYRELCRQMDAAKPFSNEASTLRNILDDSINMGSACMDWHLEHALSTQRGDGSGMGVES